MNKKPQRKQQICFTPSNDFQIRLENYMSVHRITIKSEAIAKICDDWITLQKDNLTLKMLITGKQPKEKLVVGEKIGKFDCLKDLDFHKDKNVMLSACKKCSSENLKLFNLCTSKKEFR